MYVADPGNTRIAVIGSDGAFVQSIGAKGAGPGEFQVVTGVCVLNDDRIVVTDVFGPSTKVHFFNPMELTSKPSNLFLARSLPT